MERFTLIRSIDYFMDTALNRQAFAMKKGKAKTAPDRAVFTKRMEVT